VTAATGEAIFLSRESGYSRMSRTINACKMHTRDAESPLNPYFAAV
jgi:hypothetical protein